VETHATLKDSTVPAQQANPVATLVAERLQSKAKAARKMGSI